MRSADGRSAAAAGRAGAEQSGRDAHIGAVDVDRADRVERREGVLDLAGEGDPDRALEGGEHGLQARERVLAQSLLAEAPAVLVAAAGRWLLSAQERPPRCHPGASPSSSTRRTECGGLRRQGSWLRGGAKASQGGEVDKSTNRPAKRAASARVPGQDDSNLGCKQMRGTTLRPKALAPRLPLLVSQPRCAIVSAFPPVLPLRAVRCWAVTGGDVPPRHRSPEGAGRLLLLLHVKTTSTRGGIERGRRRCRRRGKW